MNFEICIVKIKQTAVCGFGLILMKHMDIFYDFTWAC